jgi:hypothetical protein
VPGFEAEQSVKKLRLVTIVKEKMRGEKITLITMIYDYTRSTANRSQLIEATKNTEGAHDEHVRDAATHRAAREATNLLTATPDEAAILIDAW